MSSGPFRFIAFEDQLGIGKAGAIRAQIGAVAKQNVELAPYTLANEMICAELGRLLGLPVPAWGLVEAPNQTGRMETWFASLDFNLKGDTLPPVNPKEVVDELPLEATGVLIFDMWIANPDRNRQNLSLDLSSKPPKLSVFDHGWALLGGQAGCGAERLKAVEGHLGISFGQGVGAHTGPHRHCLLDALSTDEHFGFWLERIRTIPDWQVQAACGQAAGRGATPSELKAAETFLLKRKKRKRLDRLITKNRERFPEIRTWRLIP